MDFKEFIESLGNALGMRLENAGGACGLDVDDVTVILHDADDLVLLAAEIGADDLVLLAAEIGPPPPEEGLETLFSTVLKANWLYRGTGGATLAINPEDGCIWLEKYNFLERLDGAKGVEMVTRFAETAKTWRGLVADFKPNVPSGGNPTHDPAFGDFMQV